MDFRRKNKTVVVGAEEIEENPTNTGGKRDLKGEGLRNTDSEMGERLAFPRFPAFGEKSGVLTTVLDVRFSAVDGSFSSVFPQTLYPLVGSGVVGLEAHHGGDLGRFGLQAGVETGVVVFDGGGGVLQTVAGEHTHHRGPRRHLVFALQQACH